MVTLNDFFVKIWDGTNFEIFPLNKSYCYLSLLREDERIYTDYIKRWRRTRGTRCSIPWSEFLKIYNDIKEYGWDFDKKNNILVDGRYGKLLIKDGQHRCAILLHIYSEKLNMEKTEYGFRPVLGEVKWKK